MSHITGPDGEIYDVDAAAKIVIEPKKLEVERTPDRPPTAISVDMKSQLMVAKDNTEMIRIIKVFMHGKAIPKSLDTEAKVIAAWQMAASLKVPPAIAIQNMAFVNGTISLWGELPRALALATGEVEDFVLRRIDKDHNVICLANKNLNAEPWGSVLNIQRKGHSENEFYFTMNDAKRAGLDTKNGPWQNYRPVMVDRRLIAYGVKMIFADALMGLTIAEYDHHQAPDLMDVTPSETKETLNNRIKATLSDSPEGNE